MNRFRRSLFIFILMFSTLSVSACSIDNKGRMAKKDDLQLLTTLELKQPNGLSSELKYYGKGDIAYKQTAKSEIPYIIFGGKEKAKERIDPIVKQYKELKGVTHKIEYGDTSAIEELEVDYVNVDIEQLKKVPGILLNGDNPKNGVSVSKSVEILKKNGYVEKK